jgi:hypothetical protein
MDNEQSIQEQKPVHVFEEPIRIDGVTVIPATLVAKGRGRNGSGIAERPAGVYVVSEGQVAWRPAVDVNRIIMGGQLVMATALLVLRPLIGYWMGRRFRRRAWLRRMMA